MTFTVCNADTIDAVVAEWEDLSARVGRRFSSRPSYALNWYKTIGRGELAVCAVHRAVCLVALAPLHTRNRFGVRVLRLLGHGLGTLADILIADRAALDELVNGLSTRGMSLQLTHIEPDDPFAVAIQESPRWDTDVKIDERCHTVDLTSGRGADGLRSRTTMRRLGRIERSLKRAGSPISFELVEDGAALATRWPRIVAVADRADEHSGRINLCAPPFSSFTRSFLDAEAEAGRLLVVGMSVAGQWEAHMLGVRTGTTWEAWVSRYDPDVRRYRPGHLIMKWLCDQHDALGIDRFDMLIGDSGFKSEWANGSYDVATLTATPRGLPIRRWLIAAADRSSEFARHTVAPRIETLRFARFSPAVNG